MSAAAAGQTASPAANQRRLVGRVVSDKMQKTVVVLVERGGKGGQVAAPIARQIYEAIFLQKVAQVTLGESG